MLDIRNTEIGRGDARGQANTEAHNSATSCAPAEIPGPARCGGAVRLPPNAARSEAPHHEDAVVDTGDGPGEAVQKIIAQHGLAARDRFADPLVGQILELWRQRQDMVRLQTAMTNAAKAACRRAVCGDKAEADRLYRAIVKGGDHPRAAAVAMTILANSAAQEPIISQRKQFEKALTKLGAQLPIAHMADEIRGVSTLTLATIVGELGDLSAYHKGVPGIWKRAGLAVIDGERQRRKSGDAALLHGYRPARRSVFWNVSAALLKAQKPGDRYRDIYDTRKALELSKEIAPGVPMTAGHAHNRAMRQMVKVLLKDLWKAWPHPEGAPSAAAAHAHSYDGGDDDA